MSELQQELQDSSDVVQALADEYKADSEKLAGLSLALSEAKAGLHELEESIDLTFDEVAEQSTVLNRDVERCEFESRAITKRLARQRENLDRAISSLNDKYKECEREAQRERRAKAEAYIKSDEWLKARQMMWAVCALRDGYWDSTVQAMTPYAPDWKERKQAAIDTGLWIDDPDYPPALDYAKQVVENTRNDKR